MINKAVPVEFKWRHYEPEIILLCVRWYSSFPLSYRNLETILKERGLETDHTTIYRWVEHYAPELEKRIRRHLKRPNRSWRIDETYIKIKGKWHYLYRAVDSNGETIDFYLSKRRNKYAALTFLRKAINAGHTLMPEKLTTDKDKAYPCAIAELKKDGILPDSSVHRTNKYLNNLIEQDHRQVKRKHDQAMGYFSYKTAYNTIRGIEAMHMIHKGQVYGIPDKHPRLVKNFINRRFGLNGSIF